MAERRETPVVEFPLRGDWLVVSPPSHPRYAFDIVAIESGAVIRGGVARYLQGRARADDAFGWSARVGAPIDGVVLTAVDGMPDRVELQPWRDVLRTGVRGLHPPGDPAALAGNHVIVESRGVRFVVAHLRRGSVVVRPGDRVVAGDAVGAVGNSGNSVAPHLHLQGIGRARGPFATAPRFVVREFEHWQDGRWRVVRGAPLPRFGRVRVREATRGAGP